MSLFYRALRGSEFSASTRNLESGPKLLPATECISGTRTTSILPPTTLHHLTQNPINPPYPANLAQVSFGMGCFWCSESLFFRKKGIYITAVGYSQGVTPHPTYEEVCSGRTNHAEVVRIVYDPEIIKFEELLKEFWDRHDPSVLNRQGNDVGTQYRSGIYYTSEQQRVLAEESKKIFHNIFTTKHPTMTVVTEIEKERDFYFAEEYHQQYDAKPGSRQYCGLKPTGLVLPAEFVRRS
jgi:peptide-methionine (S)-S-oxide reductase